jgi:hypothetical protein
MRIVFRCDPAIEGKPMRPVAARGALQDWLRAMPRTAYSDLHGQEARTVKQCPPLDSVWKTRASISMPTPAMAQASSAPMCGICKTAAVGAGRANSC